MTCLSAQCLQAKPRLSADQYFLSTHSHISCGKLQVIRRQSYELSVGSCESYIYIYIYMGPCIFKKLITVQQDATYSVYYISVGSSTCFGCWHPSSAAGTAVITASGID